MGYEIPQQLKHREKIIFGLDFIQLGYAILTIIPLLILLKQDINQELKVILATIISTIGLGFIYFELTSILKDLYEYIKFKRNKNISKKLDSIIPIKEIKDDMIITNDSKLALLEIKPINFTIKTHEDKESIIYSFQKFLNSLDFEIQFVITTTNLNIDKYLNSLKSNKFLQKDFKQFVNKLIKENEIRNRKFYIIIKEVSDLNIQTKIVEEKLMQSGLKSKRIKTNQIYEMLNDFYGNTEDKPETNNPIHYLIAPKQIQTNANYFKINENYARVISAVGYPRIVELGFLDKIISSNDDYDISIHIEPYSIENTMIMLNSELQKQRADLYAHENKNSINPTLELKYKDTLKTLERMQKGQEKLFNVSLYICAKAQKIENLDLITKKVETELNSILIQPKVTLFNQIKGYESIMPLSQDKLKQKRNVTTKALSAFFPFTSPFLDIDKEGVMLGLNRNNVPVIRDIYSLSNANGIVLATSGSGKSYFTKLFILRQLLSGTHVMIVDPQSEYLDLTHHYKGDIITISRFSETIINPLDLMGHDFIEKRLTHMDLFKVMFGELSEIQKVILDKAITQTYLKKGISEHEYHNKEPPILSDLYSVLEHQASKANKVELVTYQALLNRLYMYTEGVFSFMNRQTEINFDSKFVCFNIGEMPKQVKPVVMFLILDYIYSTMKKTKSRKLLVVDEAWALLGKTEEASYIFEIVKTCRKFNLGLLLITQDVEDLLSSKAGNAVLANSSYSLLLRQKPSVINNIVKLFNLSGIEREYLLTANKGRGILIMDNDHQELRVEASPQEHKLITTNADEILRESEKRAKRREKVDITLDLDKGLFYGKDLTKEEKIYLAGNL